METHKFNEIQQKKSERKHLINFFRQLTFRYRVKFLAVQSELEINKKYAKTKGMKIVNS